MRAQEGWAREWSQLCEGESCKGEARAAAWRGTEGSGREKGQRITLQLTTLKH